MEDGNISEKNNASMIEVKTLELAQWQETEQDNAYMMKWEALQLGQLEDTTCRKNLMRMQDGKE